ncbi:hypothetical protein AB0M97_25355 [Streptomyces sp. NPDC051207]|uniref:hypothetical protein n=1 Tax=Streptomyces sp. NPDC051207 TaxID=3154641 RepID=UPI003438AF88
MNIDLTALMIATVVVAVGCTLLARRQWSGPWWLVVIGTVVAFPFSRTLMARAEDAPDGWLRSAFQVSCGLLVAVLIAPLYHRFRRSAAEKARRGTGGHAEVVPPPADR